MKFLPLLLVSLRIGAWKLWGATTASSESDIAVRDYAETRSHGRLEPGGARLPLTEDPERTAE
jgi:hypothetical protein